MKVWPVGVHVLDRFVLVPMGVAERRRLAGVDVFVVPVVVGVLVKVDR